MSAEGGKELKELNNTLDKVCLEYGCHSVPWFCKLTF